MRHVPGRGANAGAHRGKHEILAFFRRLIPCLEAFNIEVHDILANDAHAVALVQYDHRRDGRAFSQLGAEVCHFDEGERPQGPAWVQDRGCGGRLPLSTVA